MTYCTECGTPRNPGSRICTGCGMQVSAAPEDRDGWATDPLTHPRSRGRLVAVLTTLALLLACGGVVAWVALTHGTGPFRTSEPTTQPASGCSVFTCPERPAAERFSLAGDCLGVSFLRIPFRPGCRWNYFYLRAGESC